MTNREKGLAEKFRREGVVPLPGVEFRLTAEHALRAAIDTQVFSSLRELEPLDGGRAVQAVYIALLRRLPNVVPDRKRISIDCGFSESSVKRAVKLLEECQLISVEREKGKSSVYAIADLRSAETSSRCLSLIRKLVRSTGEKRGRVTSEPTSEDSRVTSGPSSRVIREPGVGSLLTHKEAIKNQSKQQAAAASVRGQGRDLEDVLHRWGLSSASYLVRRGHERSIPLLAENSERAADLIDRTMKQADWSQGAGVGAKVEYLREHVGRTVSQAEVAKAIKHRNEVSASERAKEIAVQFDEADSHGVSGIDATKFDELLSRGVERLGESEAVTRCLVVNDAVKRGMVADELLREELEDRLRAMSQRDFGAVCEELFSRNPGLQKLYPNAKVESVGLRLRLVEFLHEKTIKERSEQRDFSLRSLTTEDRRDLETEAFTQAPEIQRQAISRGGPLAEATRRVLLEEYALKLLGQPE